MTGGPLRVLHLHFGKEGGAERFFVNLATALAADGVAQRFVIRPNRSWGDAVAALGPVRHSNFRRLSLARPIIRRHVERTCRDWRPDAVMAWIGLAAQALPIRYDGPRICRLGDYPMSLKHFGRCDVIVGNTPGIVAHCRDLGWTSGSVTISNFPRDVEPVPVPRSRHDTPDDAPLLVTGGRFVHRKGMDVALRAAARIPGLHLWMFGNGECRPELEALSRELGVAERTRFLGWVDEPIHHIAAGDVLLLPSRQEALGNIVLEAWRAGVPVVAARAEGPSWFMRDRIDGLLVPIDDGETTANAVTELLRDRYLANTCIAGARARLDEMFSARAVVAAYRDLFARSRAELRALR